MLRGKRISSRIPEARIEESTTPHEPEDDLEVEEQGRRYAIPHPPGDVASQGRPPGGFRAVELRVEGAQCRLQRGRQKGEHDVADLPRAKGLDDRPKALDRLCAHARLLVPIEACDWPCESRMQVFAP